MKTLSKKVLPALIPLSFSASVFFPQALYAQNKPPAISLDSIIVTAARQAQPADDVLAQTSVITRADIESAGTATLAEVLRSKAGVEIRPLGGPGQSTGVFLRGANATHNLVLIDGQRVSSSTSGSTAFENVPLDLIERIEVVKGPLSGLYGSDAIGGVVQIFTRSSSKPRLTAEIGFGSYGTKALNAGFTAVEDRTSVSFNAAFREADAPSATNAGAGSFTFNPDHDPYRNSNVLFKLSHTLWQDETLSFSAWQSRGKTRFDAGPGDDTNTQTLGGLNLTSENHFTVWWKSKLSFGRTVDDSRIDGAYPGTFKTSQDQFAWQNDFDTVAGKWLAGVERRQENVSGSTNYDRKKRTTESMFAGVSEAAGANRLSANIRRDKEDQFGERTTGGASWGYQWQKDELVYISTGKAFRAPSFNDLYYPADPQYGGSANPQLRPERSTSYEYGWRVSGTGYHVDLALFENKIDDLIVYVVNPVTFAGKVENVKRARIRGWELAGDASMLGMATRFSLTAQKPEDRDTGKRLQSRAKLFGSLALSKTWGAWTLATSVNASGQRYDSATEARASSMGGYALLDANIRYRIDKLWTVEVSGRNLTDRRYEFAKGYNTVGRSLFLSIRAAAF